MGIRKKSEGQEDFKYTEGFMQEKLSNFFAINSVKYDIDGLYIFEWESDKFIETRAGLIYEFEIKVSKSDFKNDFKHKKDKHIILEGEERYGDKYLPKYYEFLEENRKRGEWAVNNFKKYADNSPRYLVGGHKRPNYFYYCTPPELISVDDVPWYAGLVYIDKSGLITIKKKAPKLHSEKITDGELGLGEKFYFNMDKWRTACRNARKDADYWRKKLEEELEEKGQGKAYHDLEVELEGCRKAMKELVANDSKSMDQLHKDLHYQNTMVRALVREMEEKDPQFNFWAFEEKIFGRTEKKDGEE